MNRTPRPSDIPDLETRNDQLQIEIDLLKDKNGRNTKLCHVDKVTPCVRYLDEDCDHDSCEDCEVAYTHMVWLEGEVKRLTAQLNVHREVGDESENEALNLQTENDQLKKQVVQLGEFIDGTDNREAFIDWCNCNKVLKIL